MNMPVASVRDRVTSAQWNSAQCHTSVVVATYQRPGFLHQLVDALAAQTVPIEVVIVDDGSTDTTWSTLQSIAKASSLPLLAIRLDHTGGPSIPRNSAAMHARGEIVIITDDDCLPEPGWAAGLSVALRDPAVVIAQGATRPTDDTHGPWDRTVSVAAPSGLYETCNLGIRRDRFIELGGFPVADVLARVPRGFGEDVLFGARAARSGELAWAPDAVVRHRWVRTSYAEHLRGRWRSRGFPWLAEQVPELVERLPARVFLSTRTLEFDAAVASIVAASITRKPALLVATLPWLRRHVPAAKQRAGRPVAIRLAQEAIADGVGLGALVYGSVKHRRVVL